MRSDLTGVEVAALLAVAQDHALGQPAGSQLRAAVLAQHLAGAAEVDPSVRAATWWTSTLRFLGCTGHAFDMAVVFGDEIEMRARAARYDFSNPFEVLRVMVASAGANRTGVARLRSVLSVLAGGGRRRPSSTSAQRARSPTCSPSASAWTKPCWRPFRRRSNAGTARDCPSG